AAGFSCLVPPIWLPGVGQYFAKLRVDGIDGEISTAEQPVEADTFECHGRVPWEHYVPVVRRAMHDRGVNPVVRERVAAQLQQQDTLDGRRRRQEAPIPDDHAVGSALSPSSGCSPAANGWNSAPIRMLNRPPSSRNSSARDRVRTKVDARRRVARGGG